MAELARSFRPASEPLPVTWMASDTCGADKLDHDRDRCVNVEWHRHKKVISAQQQPNAYEASLCWVSISRDYL